ncbi:MAG: CAP domain-containing protein [Thermomicrobiales bacterium]
MRRLALLVASVLIALTALTWVGPTSVVIAQGYSPDDEELAFVDLINAYRANNGLGPLSLNSELGAAADYHSYDMATNNYFDHYLFDGTDPGTNLQNFGYTGFPWGENIASGMASAQEVLTAWQNSPGHNAEMLNPEFIEIGIGRYYNENSYYGWYWTADFGGGEAPTSQEVSAPVVDPAAEPVAAPDDGSLISGDTSVDGNVSLDGSTTTVQEPATVTTNDGGVVEFQQPVVNADGDRAVSTGSNPVADGTGDTVIYGDINTGGVTGESVVYEPPSLTVTGDAPAPAPVSNDAAPAPVTTGDPVPAAPVMTDATLSETTTTNISMEDGNGRAIG